MNPKTLVVIPTLNEASNIAILLDRILALHITNLAVLVVDEHSPDGTASLVEGFACRNSGSVYLLNQSEKGFGEAYREGFQWGLDRQFEMFVEMDADLSHDPDQIPEFLEALKTFDGVMGTRYAKGGRTEGWPWYRTFLSRSGNLYARCVLGIPFSDLTGGYVAWRASAVETFLKCDLKVRGYSFQILLKHLAHRGGLRLKEIPILFRDRTRGESKLGPSIIAEAIVTIPRLRFY